MKEEVATRLAEVIHLLHLEDNYFYTNAQLANIIGVSLSTIKRYKEYIRLLDKALQIKEKELCNKHT
ncbi:hypothetical protein MLC52_06995 [Sulfurimonas sp. NW15]|uniref:hypothetical protein n=1 Tax=Sulfurimonas sp. NW15 TaxID=2922729 RepID=UPI003DA88965